ncbi:MAG: glyoxalase/bleomycin resistance/extradiol dioxygenase family protein [Sphingomonas bacterium]|uniref:VOC family protein n=1 Tax=Sphingomonas bacterium TaxID=1895847 RepID=UPI00262B61B0|nr:VOC family protein [Sphingomonas bacterium]MDB5705094.1 glyoxalase/bleomycin resistance/extradiol dioxygenase family protein [Sphingomonas bacterium]
MPVELNHTIVWCRDKQTSAAFLAGILGRPDPKPFMQFMVVDLDNGVSLDFMEKQGDVALQHYAFLLGEEDFDAAFARIRAAGLDHWADPARTKPGEINHHDGGRGVYFPDPNGHLLEIITRPYGTG